MEVTLAFEDTYCKKIESSAPEQYVYLTQFSSHMQSKLP